MEEGFDQIAQHYDTDFVHSSIGKMQRQLVWRYLEKYFKQHTDLNILELNCGTGEDALWLAEKGHSILATDVSEKMVEITHSKAKMSEWSENISSSILDISRPETYPTDNRFDLIFSNFGGLNCISPETLSNVIPTMAKLLKPNGHLIAVVMPKYCLWESLYFTLKGKFNEVFRRNRSGFLDVPVGDQTVKTWYFSPKQFAKICGQSFEIKRKLPLGFFLPPSYLENYFERHPTQLRMLNWKEKLITNWAFLSPSADHFIIDMEVRS